MNPRVLPGAEPFSFEGGPTGILLVHGFTGNPVSLRPWGEWLAERGYSVLCPRLPGHGTSWQDLSGRGAAEWVEEVDQALASLEERCRAVVACGLSFGGTLVMHLAARRPDSLRGAVVVNPYVNDRRHALLPLGRLFLRTWRGIGNDIKRPGPDELPYERIPLNAWQEAGRLMKAVREQLPAIRIPLLLFQSTQDHVVPKGNAELVMERIGSEPKELVLLPDSFHVATMDNDADTIFERTHAFVSSLVAA